MLKKEQKTSVTSGMKKMVKKVLTSKKLRDASKMIALAAIIGPTGYWGS